MLGAIVGDIVGSRFEFDNYRHKDFELFTPQCFPTDDTIMTLAVGKSILETEKELATLDEPTREKTRRERLARNTVHYLQSIGRPYPDCGYGGMFLQWMYADEPKPYNSFGNGAAMRISPVGFYAKSQAQLLEYCEAITAVSHNHPEGIKGATATAEAIYCARKGDSIAAIKAMIERKYYSLDFTIDGIRARYAFNETCQETVPQAIRAFVESTSFEDALRIAISLGGDSDTLAAITGSIAEAHYGIPHNIKEKALAYLDARLHALYNEWTCFLNTSDN